MQYSGKPPRPNGKIKNHNPTTPSYNGGINYISPPPNVSNSGQLQINRKFIINRPNTNEASVSQYHRPTNMQIKNNLEINHFQNFRHQQQAFMYKNLEYHNNCINPNMPQKYPIHFQMQRKTLNDQARAAASLSQPHRSVEYLSKRSNDFRNPQNINNINNKSKYIKTSSKKQPTTPQVITKNHESTHVLEEHAANGNTNLIRHKQQVPEIVERELKSADDDKENKKTDIEQNIEQLLNSSNEQSSIEEHNDNTSNKSTNTTRVKTPMCLINDLARYNKILFQYRLTSENGPAHCKRFTVTLMLGDEEYTAEGQKIKEAQHMAAKEAIEKTKYQHPMPKVERADDGKAKITPTVELNALAMKLGLQTYYIIDHQQIENISKYKSIKQQFYTNHTVAQQQTTGAMHNILNNQRRQNFSGSYQNRFLPFPHMASQNGTVPSAYTFYSPSCPTKITLIVGTKQFVGVGKTFQLAKHDAASNALKVLKEQIAKEQLQLQNESLLEENNNKSPISLVFEIGIKRNLAVDFKVLREDGPAHMRTYVTACIVGDIVTEAEGTGKKLSKKKAADKMLEELKKLPPLSPAASPVKRTKFKASSNKTSDQSAAKDVVVNSAESKDVEKSIFHSSKAESKDVEKPLCHRSRRHNAETEASNPINKLIEWHQNKKEKEPEFKLINELGQENARRKQFIMEVSSNNIVVRGVGINKRLAKQDAAQKFLNAVTDTAEQQTSQEAATTASESTLKRTNIVKKNRNETSSKLANSRTFGKQQAEVKKLLTKETTTTITDSKKLPSATEENDEKLIETAKVKEIQNAQTSTTKENCNKLLTNKESSCLPQETSQTTTAEAPLPAAISSTAANSKESMLTTNSNKSPNLHMKDQLMYLAKLLGFEVEFSDYPKGNHNEFLTIVMLSTTPPQICHGVGANANESQQDAAKNALKILSEMGLNNAVKS